MSKELAETFVYCSLAKILWEELRERFGETNGPQLYKIQREISSIPQGGNNLASYFNRLKKLWDDLNRLRLVPSCDCGGCMCELSRKYAEIESSTKMIQFLMGLSEGFEVPRNQILMQDTLPNVNRIYAMLQNVESQKNVQKNLKRH